MDMGDYARIQVDNMLDKATSVQRSLKMAELIMEELSGDLLAYSLGQTPAYEISSAIRMLQTARDRLESLRFGPVLQTQSDLAIYRNKLS
jgi:hypothetical protein